MICGERGAAAAHQSNPALCPRTGFLGLIGSLLVIFAKEAGFQYESVAGRNEDRQDEGEVWPGQSPVGFDLFASRILVRRTAILRFLLKDE